MADYVVAIDQGTSSTKALLVDRSGAVVASGSAPVGIAYPSPGWVEQDAQDILRGVRLAAAAALRDVDPARVVAVGLSTQRESALVWDRVSGEPLGPVLGWQDQRSRDICIRLRGSEKEIASLSGLPLDPMFSAAKLRWLLDAAPSASAVGTVDSWLVYALTGAHHIERGNASRTQLLDVRTGTWSPRLLSLFGIPASVLPEITPSSGDLGVIGPAGGVLASLPIRAILGDSHAALFAHASSSGGSFGGAFGGAKVTYGTGSSVMGLLSSPSTGLGLTIAWDAPDVVRIGAQSKNTDVQLAAEGNIRSSGATIGWLATLLGVSTERVAELARGASSDGVFLVPAFGGLAAPWWDDAASGLITGLSLGSGPAQLAAAALESIAHQVTDVLDDLPDVSQVLADGGASANDHLMQIQADLAGVPVRRARTRNLSALGAANLAAPWPAAPIAYDEFRPRIDQDDRSALRSAWRAAVHRALTTAVGS
ncbi:FGGY family carbohydrate kinase [Actinoplanes sp. NPDC089786]|uniref:FGGY family carbohydrate kinase n=1 Tax=Actinoplanes sp. NPDC089786 TaxID=3155185 RepID=UPI0034448B96